MRRTPFRIYALVSFCLGAVACTEGIPPQASETTGPAPATPATPETDQALAPDPFLGQEKLRSGEVTTERPEVGSIGGCTATLIAADLAITASHCLNYGTATRRGRYFTFTLEGPNGDHRVVVDRYRSFSRDLGDYDVALLGLATPVPESVALPAPIAAEFPPEGTSVTVYGYGCTSIGRGSDGRKRKATFRHGDDSAHLCPGDSGGPVFDNRTGAIYGINSGYRLDRARTDIFGFVPAVYEDFRRVALEWTSTGLPGAPEPGEPPPGGGDGPQDEEGVDFRTCSQTLDCRRSACGLDGAACLQGCLDRSAPTAVVLWRAVYDCAKNAGCRDFACTESRCGGQLQACAADPGPPAGEPPADEQPEDEQPEGEQPAPDGPAPRCGSEMQVFSLWACTSNAGFRHRCLEGQDPVWETCAFGCWRPGPGVDAECREAPPSPDGPAPHALHGPCGDAYRPYDVWACGNDGRTLVRCADDQVQTHRCANACERISRAVDVCR